MNAMNIFDGPNGVKPAPFSGDKLAGSQLSLSILPSRSSLFSLGKSLFDHCWAKFDASLMSTTSVAITPREVATVPSLAKAKEKIFSSL
jgi:hypothetical protein